MTDVVVGVGNPVMGDDGVGKAVVDALYDAGIPDEYDLSVYHAGTTAFLALEAMSGADRAVVVDAIDVDAPPGTVHRFRFRDGEFDGFGDVTMHDVSFADALDAGQAAYDLPDEITLVGVVPAVVEPGVGLSDDLAARLDEIVDAVCTELNITTESELENEGLTMEGKWYCKDCEQYIEKDAIDDHERQGHEVKGQLKPERLLEQDPWEVGDEEPAGDVE